MKLTILLSLATVLVFSYAQQDELTEPPSAEPTTTAAEQTLVPTDPPAVSGHKLTSCPPRDDLVLRPRNRRGSRGARGRSRPHEREVGGELLDASLFGRSRSPMCVANSEVEVAVQCCRSGTTVNLNQKDGGPDGIANVTTSPDFEGYDHSECVTSEAVLEEGSACETDDGSSVKPNFALVGWASLDGGTNDGGTTGGASGDEITVSTGVELQLAINDTDGPRIIYIDGTITLNNSDNADRLLDLDRIIVRGRHDLSIIGVGNRGELDGIGIYLRNSSNIIIRNLRIHSVIEGEGDCITVDDSQHVWIDHCELYNEFQGVDKNLHDGLIDTRRKSEYLTYSWNYLHDHWKVGLTGSNEADTHDRRVTWHHNRFRNVDSRTPFVRGGRAHVYNNLYEQVRSTGINSCVGACMRIENNYFVDTHDPWGSHFTPEQGDVHTSGNALVGDTSFRNDLVPAGECTLVPPYTYSPESAPVARALVLEHAGVGVVSGNGVGISASTRGLGRRGRRSASSSLCGVSEQCFAAVSTVAEAEEFCATLRVYPETPEGDDEGWRLCTVDEVEGGACCNSSCQSNRRKIVTSDECEQDEE